MATRKPPPHPMYSDVRSLPIRGHARIRPMELIDYIAHEAYRQDCNRRRRHCVDWCYLREDTRKRLVKEARHRINAWLWKMRAQRREISIRRNAARINTVIANAAQKILIDVKRGQGADDPQLAGKVESAITKAIQNVLAVEP